MNPPKKTLEPKRERGEPAVETDNKKRLANRLLVLVYPHDLAQLIFIQTQRLFAEDVLAGLQGCQHLSGMQVMTSGDDDGVDRQIADQSVFIGGTVVKSELLRDVLGMGAVGGTHADQRHTTNSFYRRQQRAGGEATRSEQSDSNRFRGGNGGRSTLPGHCYTPGFLGKLRISNQDSEEGLLRFPSDEVICRLRLVNRKSVRNQSAHIHFAIGEKLEKSLHVAGFGPANIANGVINAFLFVGCVITSGPIGAGNAEVQFLLVKRPALEGHAHDANRDDGGAVPSHFGG